MSAKSKATERSRRHPVVKLCTEVLYGSDRDQAGQRPEHGLHRKTREKARSPTREERAAWEQAISGWRWI